MAERIFDKLVSVQAQKRYGQARFFGSCQFGDTSFGSGEQYIDCALFGHSSFGEVGFGEIYMLTGIWKKYKVDGEYRNTRVGYYHPYDPRSENQLLWRGKLRAVVSAWQSLGIDEKKKYNRLARHYKMSGFNLYIKRNIHSF
jgi:hypothetical protein